jgi:seryl-tRNA synthetase
MTLDILHFIQAKGGNPDEIRESQRKRGLSGEIVDEVAQMYADWVKRMCRFQYCRPLLISVIPIATVDYEASTLAKSVNQVQKEIAAKKKVTQPMQS